MTACIFLGPTLPVAEARALFAATYLPPVRQGDVYRAIRRLRPSAIGIVDGYFHQVPSVWHKEILWAMSEGVHVFGSASMGALRAAELHSFGMEGVGRVFSAFRDEVLEDDDEVAVIHAPEEIGFVAASEAMVNIRWTLDKACADAIIDPATSKHLKGIAKSLFYPKRSYAEVLERGAEAGLPEDEIAALGTWLEKNRIDAKRDDALHMLRRMKARFDDGPAAKCVDYTFEHTTMWDVATVALDEQRRDETSDDGAPIEGWLMDEIRLDDAHEGMRDAALVRLLVSGEAKRRELLVSDHERRQAVNAFRREHGLHRGADLRAWLAAHDLDREDVGRLVGNDLLLEKVAEDLRREIDRAVLDMIRLDDDHERLVARAEAKRRALETSSEDRELTDDSRALTWYFEHRTAARPPEDVDAFARRRGFTGVADFRRAVRREYRYRRICNKATFDDT